jgi:hypothetical protein
MATIGGARGILVVGGATGEDLVEFMDWDDQTQWTTLGKLNRGRGRNRPGNTKRTGNCRL